ncbi:MAG: mannose-1-phosphate guanylyltransferase/mannose-6-phosphate isomerase [Mariprofundaceae bacterium]|nr:mannose-1-phosphate guanylyltransferase/mannose-6-phosphate isomerase [Mariprofundaceae bacterium]
MPQPTLLPVILSGGSGSRLWPLSRDVFPKQFLDLTGCETLFQATVQRLNRLNSLDPLVICNEEHRFFVADQLRQCQQVPMSIMLEPCGRNTAPAVTCAALYAQQSHEKVQLLVLPADHVIADMDAFVAAVHVAQDVVGQGYMATFGIAADRAETGYGYIRHGKALGEQCFEVDCFVEKPSLEVAKSYIESGLYDWNSGMFLFDSQMWLDAMQQFEPEMLSACQLAVSNAQQDQDFTRLDHDSFAACPANSIDYAVMEKAMKVAVVPLAAKWSDVGSWSSLSDVEPSDDDGNVCIGDVILHGTHNTYVRSESRLVATVGIQDHIVVETADAVLVAHKDAVQDVKAVVNQLKAQGRTETTAHRRAYRPWGYFEAIDSGTRFQVKRILVRSGAALSLQMHHHRSEHWVVVSGTGRVTLGEKVFLLKEDESVYIPLGSRHRLENVGMIPLEIIEVQTGSYLGEDDIVRFSDEYGRESC